MPDFVHLHCHTEYSLLDGAIRLKDLCQKTVDYGMTHAAITDHGNMYGAVTFYQEAMKFGIKPILGCEMYVAEGSMHTKEQGQGRYHLVLLAENLTGYRNLLHLVSEGYIKGFHYKPRIDKALLAKHSEGLIGLSACLAGEIPRNMLRVSMEEGLKRAREYQQIFGPNNFYLELQANGLEDQFKANEKLIEAADSLGIPMVATNDCHYLEATDVEAHDILLCIQTASQVEDKKRMRFDTKELYYRPPEEMEREFAHVPQAVSNTAEIAARCNVEIDLQSNFFPVYELPEGMTLETEFRKLCKEGLQERLDKLPYDVEEQQYWDRLQYELDIICEMGFPGYFLIVQDFINWAKANNIPVGPGRGSAAGSLVAFALRITNIDPLPYDLLFERFLNVERVSMPDIDVDFCERRRLEVLGYCVDKYGEDKVAQITTFGTMKAKAVIKDVGRALGMTFAETNDIAKLIPDEMKMTIDKALDKEPDLARLYATDSQVKKLINVSRRLEGLCRHASTHAAGVVISDKAMDHYTPIYKGKKGETVTQFDMKRVEKVGLVKFDFLGLRTMTLLHDTLENIRLNGKEVPDLDTLPLDDRATYELYSRGDTDGVFQVESAGMRRYLTKLKPNTFEDLIAMLALYRPGPLGSGMVDEFIDRKHGRTEVVYPHPSLEDVLQPTYGVIVYQEQVMSIAQIMGNFSLGEGDLLRRAMGKKIEEEMAKQRVRFLAGAKENEIDEKVAGDVFDLMEMFAAYGFNKSHSAAYALISYHTGYLKTHYPAEFMAALMSSEIESQDKILKYINACRDMNITVRPADVNKSLWQFTVHGSDVLFGLGAVKGVGDEAIRELVARREEEGPYTSLLDLCTRVNLRKVTKRVLEALIKAGALDCLGATRQALWAGLERVVAYAQKKQKEKDSGQLSMMGMLAGGEEQKLPGLGLACEEQALDDWPEDEKLAYEKEAIGFYLTSHPLLSYRPEMKRMGLPQLIDCADMNAKSEVQVALIITGVRELYTKKGDKMAICQVEDLSSTCEMLVFPRAFEVMRDHLHTDGPLLVKATIGEQDDAEDGAIRKAKLFAESARPFSEARVLTEDQPVELDVPCANCTEAHLDSLIDVIGRFPGPTPVQLTLQFDDYICAMRLDPGYTVATSREFWRAVDAWQRGEEYQPLQ